MAETKNETIRLQTLQETTDRYIQALCKQRDFINGKIERMSEYRNQIHEQLYKMFREGDVEDYNKTVFDTYVPWKNKRKRPGTKRTKHMPRQPDTKVTTNV